MLSDRVYVVAGGGNGIGKAAAVELGRHGATVVVNDLGVDVHGEESDDGSLDDVIEEVEAVGGTATAHYGDVSSLEYTERLVEETHGTYGRLDGVANFAGILKDALSYKMTGEEWDDVIRVHLRGHFSLLRNAGSHWREIAEDDVDRPQRSFLSVTSRSALGNAGQANYSAAKAGILGLTRTTAQELYRHDVRVNALMPTAFTRMIEDIPESQRSFDEEEMPASKIAPVVAFLMSDDATDVTGCTIRAAGDSIGIVSNPELTRVGYSTDGWSVEELQEHFHDAVGSGTNLKKTSREF
ncbi:SDR family oxidoreductase [Halorubellus sp. JP-L1]|nr:SDR family oxidoreductase [Halorubellus sp. JP-L1]